MTRRLDVRLLAPLAGFLLSYLLSGPACADERVAAHMRQTLVGVRAVAVLVIGVDSDIQRAGLSKSTLKSDVEVKLRQAGLLVVEPSSSDGIVWVELVALDRDEEEPRYAYAMNLQFWQRVSLERNGSRSGAITWQTSLMVGIAGSGRFTDLARQTIRDNVDTFLTAYLAANKR
jgi:hypothetical protein